MSYNVTGYVVGWLFNSLQDGKKMMAIFVLSTNEAITWTDTHTQTHTHTNTHTHANTHTRKHKHTHTHTEMDKQATGSLAMVESCRFA